MNPCIRAAIGALWVVLMLPALVFGQGGSSNITTTTSASTQAGTINAIYVWTTETIGPGSISVGALTGCVLIGSPPFAGCILGGGSGTQADPFAYACAPPLPLAGCSGGTPFNVLAGTLNYDTHAQTVIAAVRAPANSVPLGPWVSLVSAGGVILAVLLLRRRRTMI